MLTIIGICWGCSGCARWRSDRLPLVRGWLALRDKADVRMRRVPWILAGAVALLLRAADRKVPVSAGQECQVVTTAAAPPVPAESARRSGNTATPAPSKPADKNDDSQAPK